MASARTMNGRLIQPGAYCSGPPKPFLNDIPAVAVVWIGFKILHALVQDFPVPFGHGNRLRRGRDSIPQRLDVVVYRQSSNPGGGNGTRFGMSARPQETISISITQRWIERCTRRSIVRRYSGTTTTADGEIDDTDKWGVSDPAGRPWDRFCKLQAESLPRWTAENRPLIDTAKPAIIGRAAETSGVLLRRPPRCASRSGLWCASSAARI